MDFKMMTPGPTQVRENVRLARSIECTNPDLDVSFVEFYKETCLLISKLLNTSNETIIMDGEGILGLEAACASLTEPGDRVLVLDNGIYGKGFADFVTMYGGEVEYFTAPYDEAISVENLREYLKEHHDYKYATLVHCDTPSGMLNPVEDLSRLLHEYGIMTVSDKAKEVMNSRKTPIASFYANINAFKGYYENKWFPYTMPISDIYGLRQALDNIAQDTDLYDRHERLASYVREELLGMGLKLYGKNGYSNTVSVFCVPDGFTSQQILDAMLNDHKIMLAGSFDIFAGKLIRIGHMGENCNEADVKATIAALKTILN